MKHDKGWMMGMPRLWLDEEIYDYIREHEAVLMRQPCTSQGWPDASCTGESCVNEACAEQAGPEQVASEEICANQGYTEDFYTENFYTGQCCTEEVGMDPFRMRQSPMGEKNIPQALPRQSPLSRPFLDMFIARALRRSIGHMARNSLFYKKMFAEYSDVLHAIESREHPLSVLLTLIEALPFTTPQDLAGNSEAFLSIGHSDVAGLISILTSGTTSETAFATVSASKHGMALGALSGTSSGTAPNAFFTTSVPPAVDAASSCMVGGTFDDASGDTFGGASRTALGSLPGDVSGNPLGSTSGDVACRVSDNASGNILGNTSGVCGASPGLSPGSTAGSTADSPCFIRDERKRVFCSAFDLERTRRFFAYGMRLLLPDVQNQRVLLLMSGDRAGSVGNLLQKGLESWSIPCDIYGFPVHLPDCLEHINATRPTCIVGLPSHLMSLCRMGLSHEALGELKAVLLSGEWVSPAMKGVLEERLDCPVYLHYGLTESGLAGAVECSARTGCHIREADIHVSVVDGRGKNLPDGEWGEIVLTTLTRQATPLLRYKTGDWGRIVAGSCSCGSVIKRLEAGERLHQRLLLSDGSSLGFGELDAVLFPLPWLAGYRLVEQKTEAGIGSPPNGGGATAHKGNGGKEMFASRVLHLQLDCTESVTPSHWAEVAKALQAIPALRVITPADKQLSGGKASDSVVGIDSVVGTGIVTTNFSEESPVVVQGPGQSSGNGKASEKCARSDAELVVMLHISPCVSSLNQGTGEQVILGKRRLPL